MPTTSSPEPAPIAPKGFERAVETPETPVYPPNPLPTAQFGQVPVVGDTSSTAWNSPQQGTATPGGTGGSFGGIGGIGGIGGTGQFGQTSQTNQTNQTGQTGQTGQSGIGEPVWRAGSLGDTAATNGFGAMSAAAGGGAAGQAGVADEAIDDGVDLTKRRWPALKRDKRVPTLSRVPMQPGLGRTIVPDTSSSKRRRPAPSAPDDTTFDEPDDSRDAAPNSGRQPASPTPTPKAVATPSAVTTPPAASRPAASPTPATTPTPEPEPEPPALAPNGAHPHDEAADDSVSDIAMARAVRRATEPTDDGARRERPRRGRRPAAVAATNGSDQRDGRRDRWWPFGSTGASANEPAAGKGEKSTAPSGAATAERRPTKARPPGARASATASASRPAGAQGSGARPAGARPSAARPGGARPSAARPAGAGPSAARPAKAGTPGPRPQGAGRQGPGRQPNGTRPAGENASTAPARRPRKDRPDEVPGQRRGGGAGAAGGTSAAAEVTASSPTSRRSARGHASARPGLLGRLFGQSGSTRRAATDQRSRTPRGDVAERHGRHAGLSVDLAAPTAPLPAPAAPVTPSSAPPGTATAAPTRAPVTAPTTAPVKTLVTAPAPHLFEQRGSHDQSVLRALGVPAAWTERLGEGDRFAGLGDVLADLPDLEIELDAPLVVVVGPAGVSRLEAHRTALDLSTGWDPRPVTTFEVGHDVPDDAVAAWRASVPAVAAVEIATGKHDESAVVTLLRRLQPDLVIAVVDAGQPLAETSRWIESLPRVDAIAVEGALDAPQPAASLQLGLPVVRLDGIAIDRIGWTSLLCASLTTAASQAAAVPTSVISPLSQEQA